MLHMVKSLPVHEICLFVKYTKSHESISTVAGLWETVNCGDEYNYFCKRSQAPPVNSTVAPTQPPKGGCAPEWTQFEGKVITYIFFSNKCRTL